MDRLEAMSILLRVADKGSFSAASRELGVPLATVSRKVQELEAHLGTRLLVRTTRKVALSDAGASYVASARRILEQIDDTERAATGAARVPRGELVVTAPVLFGRLHLLPVVSDFLAAYPEINVQLVLSDQRLHLIDERVDLAARIGALPSSSMVATSLGNMRHVVCGSPELLAVHGVPRVPKDLAAFPSVHFDTIAHAPVWSFRHAQDGKRVELALHPRLTVSTAEAAVWAAARGVGVTRVLHYQCADAVRAGTLRIVLAKFELAPLPVHLLHAGGGELPTKTRVFIDFAVPRLRAQLKVS